MNLWAVVPVKPLDKAKSRLAGALAPEERVALVQRLLERTLEVLRLVPAVAEIVVVTSDPGVAAGRAGAATEWCRERGPAGPERRAGGRHANGAKPTRWRRC